MDRAATKDLGNHYAYSQHTIRWFLGSLGTPEHMCGNNQEGNQANFGTTEQVVIVFGDGLFASIQRYVWDAGQKNRESSCGTSKKWGPTFSHQDNFDLRPILMNIIIIR